MHTRNPVVTVLTNGPLMALLMWSCGTTGTGTSTLPGPLAQFCGNDTTPGAGNLDRPSSVAIAVQKDGSGNLVEAFAVNVNPDVQQARALDIRKGNMVPAPNVYFPMAVKLGSFTEDVAVSDDGRVAVALDAQDHQLIFFGLGPVSDKNTWKRKGGTVSVDVRPTGLAVRGTLNDLLIAVSHAGDPTGSVSLVRWNDGNVTDQRRINVGGRPSGVGLTEDRAFAVVANAASSNAFIVPVDAGSEFPTPPLAFCDDTLRACAIDVKSATNAVTVGTQPSIPGGQRQPIALFMHIDEPVVSVVRLRTAGNMDTLPLATETLAGRVTFPSNPVAAAFAPEGAPICCSGAPFVNNPAVLASGGFAYAVVGIADGRVMYLDLDARDPEGRRGPRIIDTLGDAPGLAVDPNSEPSIYQEPGRAVGESGTPSRRPIVRTELRSDDNAGTIDQFLDATYVFTWQGILPTVGERRGHITQMQLAQGVLEDHAAGIDFVAQGVRPGDVVELPVQDGCVCPPPPAGEADAGTCDVAAVLPIIAAAGNTLRVEGSFEARECLLPSGALEHAFTYRIRAHDAFEVHRDDGLSLGRVRFFQALEAPGIRIRMLPAGYEEALPDLPETHGDDGVGVPVQPVPLNAPPTDTTLRIAVRSNFVPFALDLDDVDYNQAIYLPGNSTPTGLATAIAPVFTGVGGVASVTTKPIGILSVAGSGLILQFDLGVWPSSTDLNGRISRNSSDPSFRVFQ